MKKIIMVVLMIFAALKLDAISTTMNHRVVCSSPLLYKQNDYSFGSLSLEFEPWVSEMFDAQHTVNNLTPQGLQTLSFNQQGYGDVNPGWMYLGSSNEDFNYASKITLNPTLQMYGLLFHTYRQFEYAFFDVRTALLQTKTQIELQEIGGGNGGLNNLSYVSIYNAYDAFTQDDFKYGKIGNENRVTGFDNIQIMVGGCNQFQDEDTKSFFAGFALVEVPTGAGTKSEWLFEPQVGTNHWGIGFGFDTMFINKNGFYFVLGGNFRHFIANWETRSFDLIENGPWSRYLLITPLASLDGQINVGMPGINIFTQDALVQGRNQINVYARLEKRFEECDFELSYNFFYGQAELISQITKIPAGYGIFALNSGGGLSTASTAHINQTYADDSDYQNYFTLDNSAVQLVTSDLDKVSGAASMQLNSSVAARLKRVRENYTYGIGAAVDLANSQQSISTWSVWAHFEILLS